MWEISRDWIDGYIRVVNACLSDDDKFRTFKSSRGYAAILGDGNMPVDEMLLLYEDTIKHTPEVVDKDVFATLDSVGSPSLVSVGGMQTSCRNIRYAHTTSLIKRSFPNATRIAEVGVGYGGLAYVVCKNMSISGYRLFDIPQVVLLAKKHMRAIGFVQDDQFYSIEPPYDVIISESGISELDEKEIGSYYENYVSKSDGFLFRVNFSSQPHGDRKSERVLSMLRRDFVVDIASDVPGHNNKDMWIGKKR